MVNIVLGPYGLTDNLDALERASVDEGYNFLKRLRKGLEDKSNTFEGDYELLLCAKDNEGKIVAIGGVQADPYEDDIRIGRLRHLYVHPDSRRHKVGKMLLKLY